MGKGTALVVLATAGTASAANPIRKVVTLLQNMQAKVTAEGEKADELFDKFMCYCKNSGGDLAKSIETADTQVGELGPAIEADSSKKAALEGDVKSHQEDRDAAKTAMSEATALREKEKVAHDKYMTESNTNLAALSKAITALDRGMAGGFLQTPSASILRNFISTSSSIMDSDRQELTAFLSAKEGEGYAPQSGEITGILKQLRDEMSKDQSAAVTTELAAVRAYGDLMAAKKKEVALLSKSLESKLGRISDLGVHIATMKNELSDAEESLLEDKAFAADLEKNCASKKAVHEQEMAMRAQEAQALAETIKILNDDDALELFKKTLPGSASSSLVQVNVASSAMKAKASRMLEQLSSRLPSGSRAQVDFISLALRGKQVGFEKVFKMIDGLVATLKQEQQDDDHKREYCLRQLAKANETEEELDNEEEQTCHVRIGVITDEIDKLKDEIQQLKDGIASLDKSVAEATANRQAEHAAYKDLMASNGAAKELILFAKNRLQKFYNPKLHKAPTTASPSFLQVAAKRDAPPPPPQTMEAYAKNSEGSAGVLSMMDLLVKDLVQEMRQAEAEEKAAQLAYDQFMADAAKKRAADAKSLADKEAALADLQAELEELKESCDDTKKEHKAHQRYHHNLHAECDWLLKYYQVRKQARTDEVDSLGRAKAVLSGADFSFVQKGGVARARKFLGH